MKKVFLAALVALSATVANAQYTPEKGSFSTEIQFNPFSTDFNTFKLNGAKIQGRYFFDSKNAIRFGLGLGMNNTSEGNTVTAPNVEEFDDNAKAYNYANSVYNLLKKDKTTTKAGSFSLSLGYERHWAVAKRVDLYGGAELGIALGWAKTETTENKWDDSDLNEDGSIKKSWEEKYSVNATIDSETGDKIPTRFNFNASVFTGIDFYVYKGLYLGAEIALGINNSTAKNYTVKAETTNPDVLKKSTEVKYETSDKNLSLGFNVIPALRLGWTF